MNESPILIVGGGPVGLALALGLARQKVRSTLFESKAEIDVHSRALGILPRTLEIFRSWDIYDRFMSEGQFLTKVAVWTAGRPRPAFEIDFSVLKSTTAVQGVLILPQNQTERLLLESVKATGLTEILLGHTVRHIAQENQGVSLEVENDQGERMKYFGRYLVGCDGAHSIVRRELGWELEGKTYPTRVLLADVHIQDQRDQLPWPVFAPGYSRVLAGIRYQRNHWRLISSLHRTENEQTALDPSSIHQKVVELLGEGPAQQLWASVFHIHCRTSPHFRQGHIFLAGDAAHINSPAGGQGMNSGIQDVHNLAWKLARVLAGAEAESLLNSYETERRQAVLKSVDRYTDMLTRAGIDAPEFVRKTTARLFTLLPHLGLFPLIAPRMAMLDTSYSRSRIVSGHGQWLGHRAPDGEVTSPDGRQTRLLDLLNLGPVLLLFDDGRLPRWDRGLVKQHFQGIADLQVILIVPTGIPDTDNAYVASRSLWRTWGPLSGTAALVRPDGHVGWIERGPTLQRLGEGVRKAIGSQSN
jgi:2-polyprenyl-6-methoxyphenol hydroxylase-like FAD-dependent oxidoreductase